MTDGLASYIRPLPDDGLTIIDVAPYPPKEQPGSKVYRVTAVFRDAKDRTLRRVTLFVDKMKHGKLSQDVGNLAQYYLNRMTVPKFMRRRYKARLTPEGVELQRPDGVPLPEHDAHLMAFRL